MLKKYEIDSKPYIGVFSVTSENLTIVPDSDKGVFEEAMETEVIQTTVGGTQVIGSLMCGNSNGFLAPDIIEDREIDDLLDHTDLTVVPDNLNALGNNILVNDYGALLHPELDDITEKGLKEKLDVEVKRGSIADIEMVGSVAVATNKGVLCHPHIEEEEEETLEDLFDVPVSKSTANHGSGWIGTSLIANTKGAVIGNRTTSIEMGRIEEGLGYLD